MWLTVVLAILAALVLRRTVSAGACLPSAQRGGRPRVRDPVDRMKIWIYGLAGLLFGLSGVMQMSRLRQGDPTWRSEPSSM